MIASSYPPMLVGKKLYQQLQEIIDAECKVITEARYINMRQDLNGEELLIGDRILVCTDKEYGWLGYATIVGETNLSWKIQLDDTTWSNNKRNFEKNPKRILKA